MLHPEANTFGLPPCLHIPIAARSAEAIGEYVGAVTNRIIARDGRINALCVQPYDRGTARHPGVNLWRETRADFYEAQLHPSQQVWVHVDFRRYRAAYFRFGLPQVTEGYVLDHIHNRQATRLRGYLHPYLRLCVVSRAVNTSGGVDTGGEGMEKAFLRTLIAQGDTPDGLLARFARRPVIYADPMDITKMLDISPGTQVLNGVRDTLGLLYPTDP
ncbi:MAG TPA: hypothetical protein VGC72_04835 [Candidatus Elarobacter sp.]|jgi:hypothetical protein